MSHKGAIKFWRGVQCLKKKNGVTCHLDIWSNSSVCWHFVFKFGWLATGQFRFFWCHALWSIPPLVSKFAIKSLELDVEHHRWDLRRFGQLQFTLITISCVSGFSDFALVQVLFCGYFCGEWDLLRQKAGKKSVMRFNPEQYKQPTCFMDGNGDVQPFSK